MEIITSRQELLSKLQNVGKIIESSKTIPELESFKVTIEGINVSVTGANIAGSISSRLNCEIRDAKDLSFLLDSRAILNALKEVPEQPINIKISEEDGIHFFYNNGKFKMPYMEPTLKDRDIIRADQSVTVASDIFQSGFKTCSKFTAKDELRPIMQNVNIDYYHETGQMAFAGTTGHTLAVKKIVLDDGEDIDEQDFTVNFPAKAAKIITDIIGNKTELINLDISHTSIEAIFGEYIVNYRLFEGRFPNYNAVIPNHPYKLEVDKDDLISAIKRVSVFSEMGASLIILGIKNDTLTITGRDTTLERSANEEMPCKFNGNDMRIGFNARLLIDILTTMDGDTAVVSLLDETKAGIFTPAEDDGSLFLLMPMIVND